MDECLQYGVSSASIAPLTCCSLRWSGWYASWYRWLQQKTSFSVYFTITTKITCLLLFQLTGDSIWNMWKTQVLAYTFPTSLIDVVGVAVFRFVILLLAYAAIHLNHWFVVAVSILSLIQIFYFFSSHTHCNHVNIE